MEPVSNFFNAMRNGLGQVLIYVADDDSILPEVLLKHARRMREQPDLTWIYADVIAWDDERERELHRYASYPQPAVFGPGNPMDLLNFVFRYQVYPEIGMYRRDAFFNCCPIIKYGRIPFHMWMYRLSRAGRIAFQLDPFYREHRVLKPQFRRDHWSNMDIRLQYIGDELRCMLENISLLALQDSGSPQVPQDQVLNLKMMIDKFLHQRHGTGDSPGGDGEKLDTRGGTTAAPGALVRAGVTAGTGGGCGKPCISGGNAACPRVPRHPQRCHGVGAEGIPREHGKELHRAQFPHIRLVDETVAAEYAAERYLSLHRDTPPASGAQYAGYEFFLDRLMSNYRISEIGLNLAEL